MSREVIVAVFPSRAILVKALDHIVEREIVEIEHAAIVAKARGGETYILDDDLSADEGGIAGGTLGAAMAAFGMLQLGALALPGVGPIIALGAGAIAGSFIGGATGRFAASMLDFGFRNEQVEALAADLQAGHPALVLEVKDAAAALGTLREELKGFRAELVERLPQAQSDIRRRASQRTATSA